MFKFLLILFFSFVTLSTNAEIRDKIIENLKNTNNLDFNFEQNINGKIEHGNCVIEYPKKIFCEYSKSKNKILVSNGKSLVIKTDDGSYYRYRIKKTPLNYILDKNFLINEIKNINERIVNNKFINFTIKKDNNEINMFFDLKNFNLIGWQTLDIYQNLNITFINSLKKKSIIKKKYFYSSFHKLNFDSFIFIYFHAPC